MTRVQTHLQYGGLTGLAMVIVMVGLYVAGLSFESWSQWITYIPFLAGLIMNALAYAKANDYRITFGNVFGSCFKATAIITLVLLAWGVLSTLIFPEMREKGLEIARERMMQDPNMTEETVDTALQMTDKFFLPFMIAGIVFGNLFFGAIFSLIAAAIPKKKGDGMPPIAQ